MPGALGPRRDWGPHNVGIEAINVLRKAIRDLEIDRLPTEDLRSICIRLEDQGAVADSETSPYFIHYDFAASPLQWIQNAFLLSTPHSVINFSYFDEEIEPPSGYIIAPSATRDRCFAKPYYIESEPGAGLHHKRCIGLNAITRYFDRHCWRYDLSFVGFRGALFSSPPNPVTQFDSRNCRRFLLRQLAESFLPQHPNLKTLFRVNVQYFFVDMTTPDVQREELNARTQYLESVNDTRLVLCPRGGATNSFRFFEALACCNVPIYIGDGDTKLPLDWIIDWDKACFRISCEELVMEAGRSGWRRFCQ